MSVAYEPRNFIHEGAYPSMGDEHDHAADQRYTDNDVAEQLSHYTTEGMLPDDRDVMGDDRGMMHDDGTMDDGTRLDLSGPGFSSPIQVHMQAPQLSEPVPESKDESPAGDASPPSRSKTLTKPEREAVKQADGKFHCPLADCKEDVRSFSRKCEWK